MQNIIRLLLFLSICWTSFGQESKNTKYDQNESFKRNYISVKLDDKSLNDNFVILKNYAETKNFLLGIDDNNGIILKIFDDNILIEKVYFVDYNLNGIFLIYSFFNQGREIEEYNYLYLNLKTKKLYNDVIDGNIESENPIKEILFSKDLKNKVIVKYKYLKKDSQMSFEYNDKNDLEIKTDGTLRIVE